MQRRNLGYTSTPKRGNVQANAFSFDSKCVNSRQVVRSNKRLIDGDISPDTAQMCIKKKIQCCENVNSTICAKLQSANSKVYTIGGGNNCSSTFPQCSEIKENGQSLSKLFSMDESFLEEIDFDSVERNAINKEDNTGKDPILLEKAFSDHDSDDDSAWDMSVSLDTDKILNVSNLIVNNTSPDYSRCTQVRNSPKLLLQDRLRRSLKNNAQKPVEVSNVVLSKKGVGNVKNSSFCGLPEEFRRLLKKYKGITNLYEWQEECLNLSAISERQNLVYALPTSGGKTLVAEILILKELLCRQKNALFILPYVSIVQEKVRSLSPFAVELGFVVEEYAGSKGQYPPKKRRRKRTVFVATIEKSLGLVHSHIELNRMDELGLIVVDELHLIGEPNRGETLESVLSKVIFLSSELWYFELYP